MFSTKNTLRAVLAILVLLCLGACGGNKIDVTGEWRLTSSEEEDIQFTMELQQTGDSIGGSIHTGDDIMRLEDGRLSDKKLTFSYNIEGEGRVDWFFTVVDGLKMEGTAQTWEAGHQGETIKVQATKVQ